MTNLENELKAKKICRFCLSQDEKSLSNLYSRENRWKSSAPLPLQVMACVSIEVFTNDGMPCTICDHCRIQMEHSYRYKQMCKKADTALRQFPLTGIWPSKLEHPKLPKELVESLNSIILNESPEKEKQITKSPEKEESPNVETIKQPKLKILNKNPVKILNKEASISREPVLKQPVIKHSKDGTIELVTEIIDTENYRKEIDPVKSAEPVKTNVFPCTYCERSFPLRQLLDIHIINHNRERNFECKNCDKKFFTKYDLQKHSLIHSDDKPFKCVICDKTFTRSTLLHRHEKIHTDIPKFLCIHCEKPFITKEELEKHIERHNKKRPFPCKICNKSFAFKQGLERHEVVHAKDQPFPCQYCNISFPNPSKLARHLTAHAGKRPFPCKLCTKSFLLSHHLSRHLRSHKEGDGTFKCYDCNKTFASRDNLIYHSAVHATQTLVCPICKEQFDNIDTVTDHIKMHGLGEQFACEFCDLIFMTQDKLDSHLSHDHAEEMVAYDEHDKLNFKNENSMKLTDESEVLQEFIIEEYHDDNIQTISNENNCDKIRVKNDNEYQTNKNNKAVKRKRSKNENIQEIETAIVESNNETYDSNCEIEFTDFTEEETALFEELLEEPSSKAPKIQENTQKNTQKLKERSSNQDSKLKESTLTTIVQKLPKGISISKKVKKSNAGDLEETILPEANNSVKNSSSSSFSINKPNKILNKSNELSKISTSESSEIMPARNKKIMLKKITLTKDRADLMIKEGRINVNKKGALILKQQTKK